MSFLKGTEDFYRKLIELQEKLRKSEEERLRLEMKFNEMVQFTREEEEAHHRKLQSQYQSFLEEDLKRHERNDRIVKVLERIENRAALLAAKTERFQLFRKQYTTYLKRMSGDVHYHPMYDIPTHSIPTTKSYDINNGSPSQSDVKSRVSERVGIDTGKFKTKYQRNGDLYNHPTIRRALNGTHKSLNDDLESLRSDWNSRFRIPETSSRVLEDNLSESSDNQEESPRFATSPTNENTFDKTTRWRPKLQLPRRNRFQFRRNRWHIPERRLTHNYPQKDPKFNPTTSPPLQKSEPLRNFDTLNKLEIPKYEDIDRDFSRKPASYVGFREDDFSFRPSKSYRLDFPEKYTEKCTHSTSPSGNYRSEDLDYQLSNYPNLDVGNKINIEYTLYPKISDIGGHRNYHPSTSYTDYQRDNYRSHSPGRNRVSWYDHYLGRCPPMDTRSVRESNKDLNGCTTSKSKQDSILLNSEVRNTKYSDYRSQTPVQQPKKVDFVDLDHQSDQGDYQNNQCGDQNGQGDERNDQVLHREMDHTKNKVSDVPKENVENIPQDATKYYDDLSKDDPDETEDQVLSEVLPDDILENSIRKEVKHDTSEPANFNANGEESKEPIVLEDSNNVENDVDEKDDSSDDYYEEKHDSLQEIQKENIIEETVCNNNEVKDGEENGSELHIAEHEVPREYNEREVFEENGDRLENNSEQEVLEQTIENEEYPQKDDKREDMLDNEDKVDEHQEVATVSDQNRKEEGKDIMDQEKKDAYISEKESIYESEKESEEIQQVLDENVPTNDIIEKVNDNAVDTESKVVSDGPQIVEDAGKIPIEETSENIEEKKEDPQENQTEVSNQQLTAEYDNSEYQPNVEPTVQYDENGEPIQYSEYGLENVQYDEHGQPIGYGDGQYYPQYDENGQLIQQYDETGQPIVQYDENGQPIVQYDENGQPMVQYDENGQPVYQYDQYYQNQQFQEGQEQYVEEQQQQYQPTDGQYGETAENQYQEVEHQQYEGVNTQYQEDHQQYQEEAKESENNAEHQYREEPSQQSEKTESEKQTLPAEAAEDVQVLPVEQTEDKKMKVLDMLDTDSERTTQDTKASNDSDFDFSNK